MDGILANIVAGGAKGGFDVMGKQAGEKISDRRDAEKQAVLEARQKNLMLLSQKFQAGESSLGREFQEGQRVAGEEFKTGQAESKMEYETGERVAGEEFKESEEALGRKSREKIAGMRGVGKGGTDYSDVKLKELWQKSYNDYVKWASEFDLESTPDQIEDKATAHANKITEQAEPKGSGGSLADYINRINDLSGENKMSGSSPLGGPELAPSHKQGLLSDGVYTGNVPAR